mmetsp:Transcript_26263/g.54827  ORF Transcript_26263/g.54827 Transcript_26263/m.54827 type:complete len:89 (-) Transcript_26263:68-334(-)
MEFSSSNESSQTLLHAIEKTLGKCLPLRYSDTKCLRSEDVWTLRSSIKNLILFLLPDIACNRLSNPPPPCLFYHAQPFLISFPPLPNN